MAKRNEEVGVEESAMDSKNALLSNSSKVRASESNSNEEESSMAKSTPKEEVRRKQIRKPVQTKTNVPNKRFPMLIKESGSSSKARGKRVREETTNETGKE